MAAVSDIREWFRQVQPATPDAAEVTGWLGELGAGGGADLDDAARLDLVAALESLKGAAAAAQARVSVAFEASQLAAQGQALKDAEAESNGRAVPEARGRGIAEQIALARRESPTRGSRHLGLAKALVHEMPHTHDALTQGSISEWTATLMVQATACLSIEDRAGVDAEMGPRLGTLSDRATGAAARALAYQADPEAWVARGRKAVGDRRVTVRPAPDVMAIVSGYVPAAQGVACHKALAQHAKTLRASGDPRSLDQIKADTFVQRLTGQATATGVPIEVGLVMSDTALLAGDTTPARLEGYGPLPAAMARDLLRPDTPGPGQDNRTSRDGQGDQRDDELIRQVDVWLRRLYTHPDSGVLTAQDATRRRFTGALRRYLIARDQVCATPFCGAPIRHLDHITSRARGGRTTAANGEGLCERCNYAKEAPGWTHEAIELAPGIRAVKITTPTGHVYYANPPPTLDTLPSATGPPAADINSAAGSPPGRHGVAGNPFIEDDRSA